MSALITMNIPRADDARKSVEQGEYDKAVKQADEVATAINTAIALGKKSIGGSGRLEASVRTKLQEMGYQYSTGTQYNESYWSVSWENPLPSKK